MDLKTRISKPMSNVGFIAFISVVYFVHYFFGYLTEFDLLRSFYKASHDASFIFTIGMIVVWILSISRKKPPTEENNNGSIQ